MADEKYTIINEDGNPVGFLVLTSPVEQQPHNDKPIPMAATRPPIAAPGVYNRVLSMSPGDVVRYFEQSAVLNIYADDVRAVLDDQDVTGDDYQLRQDVAAVRHLPSPSLADISEVLLKSRYYGGSDYKRIKKCYNAVSSSTPAEAVEMPVEVEQAA